MTKTDVETQRKYIEQTHNLYAEYSELITERRGIYDSLPSIDSDPPERIEQINKRLTAILHTMQSNAVILADILKQNLDERLPS